MNEMKKKSVKNPNAKKRYRPYVPRVDSSLPPQFHCYVCKKKYRHKRQLVRHFQVNHTNNYDRVICEICNKEFTHKSSLAEHRVLHFPAQHKCSLCQQAFKRKYSLTRHITLMHKKIKTLKCNQCGAAFKDKKAFADHLLEHKGILSYKCNVCDERYPDEESLKQHTLLHTEEIKFVCNLCDQQFSDKFQLSKHYLIHTERDKSEVTVEKYHQLVHQFVMSDNDANDEAAADDDHYVGDDHTPGEPSFDEDSTQATSGSKILNNEVVVGNSSYYQQVNNYLYFNENQQPIYQHNNQYNQSTVTQTYDGFVMTMNQNGHQGTSISISALPLSNTSNNIQTYQPAETKQYENQAINKSSDGDFVTPSSVARYDCSVCKKKYRHKKQLIHHFQQSHSNYYPGGQTGDYSEVICCDICNKVFSSKSSLEEHKEQHHSSAKQTSPSSPRQSKAKKNFIKQKIVLRKGQQFKCNRCSVTFSLKKQLAIHLLEHKGITNSMLHM